MRRRVVVTGMGCVSPVGQSPAEAWKQAREGCSGVGPITRFETAGLPTRIAAEVAGFDLGDWIDPRLLPSFAKCGPNIQYGVAAAVQAVRDAGLEVEKQVDPTRFGVYLGSGEGAQDFHLMMTVITESMDANDVCDLRRFIELGLQRLDPEIELHQEPNMLAARLAGLFHARGPNVNSLTACAASTQAIGEATELIRDGSADMMLAGGSHSMIHPFGVTGFCLLTALSKRNDDPTQASRPFDRDRDGFVLGEGAAMLVLEEFEAARKRGAKIYGEVRGYGATSDAYRITDIPPDGNGMARAMQLSLQDARLNPGDLDYINAHGTSTKTNDKVETVALKTALGEAVRAIPVSSTKGSTGHLVAACGALEAMFCLKAISDGLVPPTANYESPDPDCDLDYVPREPRERKLRTVMTNNSGFGGQNASLIFSALGDSAGR
ncbi:3-oxoacyl-[acyl-carrier-protein] synthase 2 [Caulifigura coniformis]|uniref:3-oxoacyl-[acyl-carrier-protein] synthase 2 n=1 Tax=Caulifigura coniformis TaxID=2527983 RepID=A0A517SLK6_9PLAN|nr:beta-ketoacyl-[acyl-carrier-protein] synthase family protein [Caulifigura coniformis]QDT57004.1 3-oxoacyl-[acyl-carrier-protein] synthase 2 [Caulifigura coniformis]